MKVTEKEKQIYKEVRRGILMDRNASPFITNNQSWRIAFRNQNKHKIENIKDIQTSELLMVYENYITIYDNGGRGQALAQGSIIVKTAKDRIKILKGELMYRGSTSFSFSKVEGEYKVVSGIVIKVKNIEPPRHLGQNSWK